MNADVRHGILAPADAANGAATGVSVAPRVSRMRRTPREV